MTLTREQIISDITNLIIRHQGNGDGKAASECAAKMFNNDIDFNYMEMMARIFHLPEVRDVIERTIDFAMPVEETEEIPTEETEEIPTEETEEIPTEETEEILTEETEEIPTEETEEIPTEPEDICKTEDDKCCWRGTFRQARQRGFELEEAKSIASNLIKARSAGNMKKVMRILKWISE